MRSPDVSSRRGGRCRRRRRCRLAHRLRWRRLSTANGLCWPTVGGPHGSVRRHRGADGTFHGTFDRTFDGTFDGTLIATEGHATGMPRRVSSMERRAGHGCRRCRWRTGHVCRHMCRQVIDTCIGMCIGMRIGVCVGVCIGMCTGMCEGTCLYTCTHVHVHMYTCTHVHVYTCLNTCPYTCRYTCRYISMRMYVHKFLLGPANGGTHKKLWSLTTPTCAWICVSTCV